MLKIKRIKVQWIVYPPCYNNLNDKCHIYRQDRFDKALKKVARLGTGAYLCADTEVKYSDGSLKYTQQKVVTTVG